MEAVAALSVLADLLRMGQNAALLLVGLLAHGYFRERIDGRPQAVFIDGSVFAGLALLSMAAPLTPVPGLQFDARNAIVAVAALLYGPLPAAIATLAAGTYRVSLGGAGMMGGLLSLATTFALALLLAPSSRRGERLAFGRLALAGAAIGFASLDAFLLLPSDLALPLLRTVGLPFAVANGLGVVFFGGAIALAEEHRHLMRSLRASEAAASRSEARLRAVIDNLPGSFSLKDASHRILLVNRGFERWLGVPADEAVGRTFAEVAAKLGRSDVAEQNIAETQRVIDTCRPSIEERHYAVPISGLNADVMISRFPVLDAQGAVEAVGTIITDISELKQTELILRQRREALARHQEAILEIIRGELASSKDVRAALRGICEKANSAMQSTRTAVWRHLPGQTVARRLEVWNAQLGCHEGEETCDANDISASILTGRPITAIADVGDDPILSRSAVLKAKNISALLVAPIHLDGGPQGAIVFAHVGTRHEWSLEEQMFARSMANLVGLLLLAHRHDKVMAALDVARDGICVEDADGEVIFANRAMWDITGLSRDASAQDVLQRLRPKAGRELQTPGDASHEFQLERPGAGRADIAVRRAALLQDGTVTIALDVTVRKSRDRAGLEMAQRLEQAARMESLGLLAGGIAHDFNNLLGSITSFAEFLSDDLAPASTERSYALRIVQACQRGKDLVAQLLAYARPAAAEEGVADVARVLAESTELLRPSLAAATCLQCAMPATAIEVAATPAQLGQILANLCLNANDALGGKPGLIQVEATLLPAAHPQHPARLPGPYAIGLPDSAAGYACLTVADDGCGIAPEILPRIFEPFYTTKPRGQGTGLGLAVIHGTLSALQGLCRIESELGRGTRFFVYIPLREARSEAALPARNSLPALASPRHILVVDDDIDLADAMAIGLKRAGYEVAVVNHPAEALERITLDAEHWDLVLTDEDMPQMKGLELIGRIKLLRPGLPVLLCTGYGDSVPESLARRGGADGYLKKPVEPARLSAEIAAILQRYATA